MNDNIIPIKSHLRYRRLNTIAEGYLALANDAARGMLMAANKYEAENHRQRYESNMRLFNKRKDSPSCMGIPVHYEDAS